MFENMDAILNYHMCKKLRLMDFLLTLKPASLQNFNLKSAFQGAFFLAFIAECSKSRFTGWVGDLNAPHMPYMPC